MANKWSDREQSQKENTHIKNMHASSIKKLYPEVSKITISLNTSLDEVGGWNTTPSGPIIYGPNEKAIFDFKCPNNECLRSLDLEDEIKEMVSTQEPTTSGQKVCQEFTRDRDHRCFVESDYEISITYND